MPPVNKQHIIYSCSSKQGTNQPLTFMYSTYIPYKQHTTAVKSCDLFRFPTLNDDTTTTFNDEATSHLAAKGDVQNKSKDTHSSCKDTTNSSIFWPSYMIK
jgi:hypothetical protein